MRSVPPISNDGASATKIGAENFLEWLPPRPNPLADAVVEIRPSARPAASLGEHRGSDLSPGPLMTYNPDPASAKRLSLDHFPSHIIEKIAFNLDHSDYVALRNTSPHLGEILPSLERIRTMLPAPSESRAKQFSHRLDRAFITKLNNKSPRLVAILRTVKGEISIEEEMYRLKLAFRYESHSIFGEEIFRAPVRELNRKGGFRECRGALIVLDDARGNCFEQSVYIGIDKNDPKPALDALYGTANDIWFEKCSRPEALILASMMSASKNAFLQKKAINETDKKMIRSLSESYAGMFRAGGLMQKEYGRAA